MQQKAEKTVEPKVIHIRRSGDLLALCGAGSRNIAPKYNTDEYMSSLPVCDKCSWKVA